MTTNCCGAKDKKLRGKIQKGFNEEMIALNDAIKNGEMPIEINELLNSSSCTFAILESLKSNCVVKVKYS